MPFICFSIIFIFYSILMRTNQIFCLLHWVLCTFQHFIAEWKAKTFAIFTLYRVPAFYFLSFFLSLSIAIICLCETFRNVRKWFQTSRLHYDGILLLYTYVFLYSLYNVVYTYTYMGYNSNAAPILVKYEHETCFKYANTWTQ